MTALSPTLDEARCLVARSGARLLGSLPPTTSPDAALDLLVGTTDGQVRLDEVTRRRVIRHHRLLTHLQTLGLAWMVEEELEGLASAAGLDENRFSVDGINALRRHLRVA